MSCPEPLQDAARATVAFEPASLALSEVTHIYAMGNNFRKDDCAVGEQVEQVKRAGGALSLESMLRSYAPIPEGLR